MDVAREYLPEFLQWGQTASDFVQFIYAVCGVVFIFFAIRMQKVKIKEKELDVKLKKQGLTDWEELKERLKENN